MNRLLKFVFIFHLGLSFSQDANEIVYEKNTDEINKKALDKINGALSGKIELLTFENTFICGPQLWSYLKLNGVDREISGIDVNFNIPTQNGEIQKMKGRAIQSKKELSAIWTFLFPDNSLIKFVIRKPTKNELSYYWSIIPYNIKEPIYVISRGEMRILIDFNELDILHIDMLIN